MSRWLTNVVAGPGIAYGTRRPEHLLNVAARNMSAFPDLPDHFLQWLGTRPEYAGVPDLELRERFIPRRIYGDYLQGLMQEHLQAPASATVEPVAFIECEAVDVEPERHHALGRSCRRPQSVDGESRAG